jgi:hypothetical protein
MRVCRHRVEDNTRLQFISDKIDKNLSIAYWRPIWVPQSLSSYSGLILKVLPLTIIIREFSLRILNPDPAVFEQLCRDIEPCYFSRPDIPRNTITGT